MVRMVLRLGVLQEVLLMGLSQLLSVAVSGSTIFSPGPDYTDERTGRYEDMDQDQGDVLYYSGSNSHENEDKDTPILSHSTKGLIQSRIDNRKIRVLRKAGGTSKYSPSAGLRYDGLYQIVGEEIMRNAKGGAYKRFILQRCPGQAPIDTSRPTEAEKRCLQRWKEAI